MEYYIENPINQGPGVEFNPVEEYCRKQGYRLAEQIDAKMALIVKPRPLWCPEWLYRKIIRESVEILKVK